ncbi:MAG: hypothetical protein WB559_09630, partial [Candidatus Acidiferrales bacterium]
MATSVPCATAARAEESAARTKFCLARASQAQIDLAPAVRTPERAAAPAAAAVDVTLAIPQTPAPAVQA